MRVGRNDRTEALFGGLVAAVGVGMVDFHQGFVGALDLFGLGRGCEAERFEGAAVVLMQLDGALGRRSARIRPGIPGPDVKRIGEALSARRVGILFWHAWTVVGARLGAQPPARPAIGLRGRIEMALTLLLVHVRKEVERRVVVANMLKAEMMVLALEAMALGRLVDAGLVAAFPGAIGNGGTRLRGRVPRMDADAVEELGIQFHQS